MKATIDRMIDEDIIDKDETNETFALYLVLEMLRYLDPLDTTHFHDPSLINYSHYTDDDIKEFLRNMYCTNEYVRRLIDRYINMQHNYVYEMLLSIDISED